MAAGGASGGGSDVDVAVVGAGLAGASLAVMLGRAGLTVALYEQHHFPRDKACAEGMMPVGVGVLERLGLRGVLSGSPFGGIRYHGFGQRLEATFPTASGASGPQAAWGSAERRLLLDARLFAAARSTPGVTCHEGTKVEGPLLAWGRVVGVKLPGQIQRARLVVAADGPRSLMRRRLELDPPRRDRARMGVRAHFKLADGNPAVDEAADRVEVFVGGGHELYVTRLPDRQISLALLAERAAFAKGVDRFFTRARGEHPRLQALLEGAQQTSELGGRTPLAMRARRGWVPGLVLLGDAAVAIDPVTGAGMSHALLSAELLAAAIARPPAPHKPADLRAGDDVIEEFDRRRGASYREAVLFSNLVLQLVRRPRVARGSFRLMRAVPSLFSHLIGVAGGVRPLLPL